MFSFALKRGKVESSINYEVGPSHLILSRKNYDHMRNLLPKSECVPKIAQLYIYDASNELQNRMHLCHELFVLQYPLIFLYGEIGYQENISIKDSDNDAQKKMVIEEIFPSKILATMLKVVLYNESLLETSLHLEFKENKLNLIALSMMEGCFNNFS
ncbi:hypothetical protein CR513_24801, partial [Mucuna pruriens]